MYLYKKTYVKNWEFMKPEERHSITIKKGGRTVTGIDPNKVVFIVEEAGYWRKANAIHQWFVDYVQDGEDDCKEYYVSTDSLQKLLDTVNKVLAASELVDGDVHNGIQYSNGKATPIIERGKIIKDPSVAEELLPTASGFFFGGTDYDQYYVEDLERTKEILEAVLAEGGDVYYQSSW